MEPGVSPALKKNLSAAGGKRIKGVFSREKGESFSARKRREPSQKQKKSSPEKEVKKKKKSCK